MLALLLFLGACNAHAQSLRIAAASDLQFALADLAAQYEKQSGAKLAITYGSSGNFFAQIQNGAPFDLFFSADIAYPQKLIDAGFAESDSRYTYAFGRIVLWLPSESPLIPAKLQWNTLLDARIQKIAIANPDHAPYGRAAVAALQSLGLYDTLKPRLVTAENIAQAAQFVDSANADAGLISLTSALTPRLSADGAYFVIPHNLYPTIEQGAVIISSTKQRAAVHKLLDFLLSPAIQVQLAKSGLTPVK